MSSPERPSPCADRSPARAMPAAGCRRPGAAPRGPARARAAATRTGPPTAAGARAAERAIQAVRPLAPGRGLPGPATTAGSKSCSDPLPSICHSLRPADCTRRALQRDARPPPAAGPGADRCVARRARVDFQRDGRVRPSSGRLPAETAAEPGTRSRRGRRTGRRCPGRDRRVACRDAHRRRPRVEHARREIGKPGLQLHLSRRPPAARLHATAGGGSRSEHDVERMDLAARRVVGASAQVGGDRAHRQPALVDAPGAVVGERDRDLRRLVGRADLQAGGAAERRCRRLAVQAARSSARVRSSSAASGQAANGASSPVTSIEGGSAVPRHGATIPRRLPSSASCASGRLAASVAVNAAVAGASGRDASAILTCVSSGAALEI